MGLFKKPKPQTQTSESGNLAYNDIKGAVSPALGYLTSGGNAASNILGLGGGPAQTAGLNNFANSGGMNFLLDSGTRAINGNAAARGLFRSGSTGKAIEQFGQNLGSTYLQQYMDNLFKTANLGLGAGGLLASAGQWSKGTGTGATQGGLGKQLLPMIASAGIQAASDPTLKTEITLVGSIGEIPLYNFRYRQDVPELDLPEGVFEGVMADELAEIHPEDVKEINGYLFVTNKKFFPKKVGE